MKYIFKIDIYTDGDFNFPYVPRGMIFDDCYRYEFKKSYDNKKDAIKDILEICSFLRKNVHSYKEYKKESIYKCIDSFVEKIKDVEEDFDHGAIREYMYGNYDGTEFLLYTEDDYITCGFYASDEEIELFKNHEGITNEMVKKAVLDLFRNNVKKNDFKGDYYGN